MIVKKYANRRLYDTQASRYITLEELADKVRAGSDVRVIDAQTEADLTQSTLTQIILEGRGAGRLLPVPVLLRLVRMGDDALAEFFGRYVAWALDVYLTARQGAQTMMPLNPFARMMMASPWGGMGGGSLMGPPPPIDDAPLHEEHTTDEVAGDVAELRRELDELKRSLRAKPPRRKGRS